MATNVAIRTCVVLTIAAGCGRKTHAPSASSADRTRTVSTYTVHSANAVTRVDLSGEVQPLETVTVVAQVQGVLVDVRAELGDVVGEGQLLARIEATDFSARHASAAAAAQLANTELLRVQQLVERNLATEQQLTAAQTSAAIARSEQQLTQRQLRDTNIRAPFAGAIARRALSRGAYVRVGDEVFGLVSLSKRTVVVQVPARLRADLTQDQIVELNGPTQLSVPISRLAPTVDAASRTFTLHLDLPPDAPLGWAPGTFVRAALNLASDAQAVSLPQSAVVSVLGQSRVATIANGRIHWADVQVLSESGAATVVVGIPDGTTVVRLGAENLVEGEAVVGAAQNESGESGAP